MTAPNTAAVLRTRPKPLVSVQKRDEWHGQATRRKSKEVTHAECLGPVLGWHVASDHRVVHDHLPVDRCHREHQPEEHRHAGCEGSKAKPERLQN